MAKKAILLKKSRPEAASGSFTLGRSGMTKLHAVEGLKMSASSGRMFGEFDRRQVEPEQRRREIVARHAADKA